MKPRSSFVCQQCSYETPSWYGKCPGCGEWNSLIEMVKETDRNKVRKTERIQSVPQKLSDVKHIEKNRLKSGFGEFERVMGGGIVPGSVTLLAGDPGIGKSTLLLHVIARIGGLYVTGEESAEQVKLRAKRLGIDGNNISILAETEAERIVETISRFTNTTPQNNQLTGQLTTDRISNDKKLQINEINIPLVVIDSIQTLVSEELEGMAGSVGQIRHSAEILIDQAKTMGIPVIIIGHVTKEGAIAGPKVLEHMVDTVLYLEGERFATARILRTLKNRFGAVEEVGIFEMNESGLKEIDNPSEIFLKDRVDNIPGSVITVLLEGTRPLLVEIQALVVPSQLAMPRRVANGVDYNRIQLLTAILQKRLNIPLGTFDIFVNVSGGVKIEERAADLAIALSIISSFKNKPFPRKTCAFGEIGLLGEVRSVNGQVRRNREAKRLGFSIVEPSKEIRLLNQIRLLD